MSENNKLVNTNGPKDGWVIRDKTFTEIYRKDSGWCKCRVMEEDNQFSSVEIMYTYKGNKYTTKTFKINCNPMLLLDVANEMMDAINSMINKEQ